MTPRQGWRLSSRTARPCRGVAGSVPHQHARRRTHHRERRLHLGAARARNRRPRPAVRRGRPGRLRRQRRVHGRAERAVRRSGSPASRCAVARCCGACSPGRAMPGSWPTRCPRPCGWPTAPSRSAATSSSAIRPPTARPCAALAAVGVGGLRSDADGRLGGAARPHRLRRRPVGSAVAAGVPRPGRLVAPARRADPSRGAALAGALGVGRGRAGAGGAVPAGVLAGRADGLRGAGRRSR